MEQNRCKQELAFCRSFLNNLMVEYYADRGRTNHASIRVSMESVQSLKAVKCTTRLSPSLISPHKVLNTILTYLQILKPLILKFRSRPTILTKRKANQKWKSSNNSGWTQRLTRRWEYLRLSSQQGVSAAWATLTCVLAKCVQTSACATASTRIFRIESTKRK